MRMPTSSTPSHTADYYDTYLLAHAMWMQAGFWYGQRRLEEANSEVLCGVDALKKFGTVNDVEDVRELPWQIDRETFGCPRCRWIGRHGELLETVLLEATYCLYRFFVQAGLSNLNSFIDTCLEFFRCVLSLVTNASSLHSISH